MAYAVVIALLTVSNLIMTVAWYWHIKPGAGQHMPLWQMVLISWGIALFEYCLAVPANHWGAAWGIKPFQLKILQEALSLSVFTLFALFYLKSGFNVNYALSFLCLMGAVFFAFK